MSDVVAAPDTDVVAAATRLGLPVVDRDERAGNRPQVVLARLSTARPSTIVTVQARGSTVMPRALRLRALNRALHRLMTAVTGD